MTARSRPSGESRNHHSPGHRSGGGRGSVGAPGTDLDMSEHDGIAGFGTAQRSRRHPGRGLGRLKQCANPPQGLETASEILNC